MGIPDNLVVHNLIPGTGSYFYTDKRIQLKNTSTAKLRRRQAVINIFFLTGTSSLSESGTCFVWEPMLRSPARF